MKAKPFNVKKAKKELDILWSLAIRQRDKKCRHCKRAEASQAAHIFGRGNLSTRWDIENGLGMCYYCHILWAHREPVEFTLWVQAEMGVARFMALRRKSQKIYDSSNFKADYQKIKAELK